MVGAVDVIYVKWIGLDDLLGAEHGSIAAAVEVDEDGRGDRRGRDPALAQQGVNGYGMKLIQWTVNEPDEMLRLFEAGADGLITDFPDIAIETLR